MKLIEDSPTTSVCLGSVEAFEAEYGKTVTQWKDDFGKPIRSQLLAQKMQGQINQSVRSTPAEVIEYYENTPKDSLPLIPEEISFSELVIQPQILKSEKQKLKKPIAVVSDVKATGIPMFLIFCLKNSFFLQY